MRIDPNDLNSNKMKVATCPWCEGKGFIKKHACDNEPGSLIRISFEDCQKCEGSGVVAYRPLKEIHD